MSRVLALIFSTVFRRERQPEALEGGRNPSAHFSVSTWLQRLLLLHREYRWSIYHVNTDAHHGDRMERLNVNAGTPMSQAHIIFLSIKLCTNLQLSQAFISV